MKRVLAYTLSLALCAGAAWAQDDMSIYSYTPDAAVTQQPDPETPLSVTEETPVPVESDTPIPTEPTPQTPDTGMSGNSLGVIDLKSAAPASPTEVMDEPVEPKAPEYEDMSQVELRILDKVRAESRTYILNVGRTVAYANIRIRPRACRKSSPLDDPEDASFLQIWEVKPDKSSSWIFSGWMFASSPSLSGMDHPVYDVTVLDCKDPAKEAAALAEKEKAEKAEKEAAEAAAKAEEDGTIIDEEAPTTDEPVVEEEAPPATVETPAEEPSVDQPAEEVPSTNETPVDDSATPKSE